MMIISKINSARRICWLPSRNLARNTTPKPKPPTPSPYDPLLQSSSNYDMQTSTSLLNQLEQTIDKQDLLTYAQFLHNKMLVEFHFRQYGQAEMTVSNTINLLAHSDLPEEEALPYRMKQILLHMLYQGKKMRGSLKGLLGMLPKVRDEREKWMVGYLEAMGLYCMEEVEGCERKLLQLLSSDKSEIINTNKQMCLLSLIAMQYLHHRGDLTQVRRPNIIKMVENHESISYQTFLKTVPSDIYNPLIHYCLQNQPKLNEAGVNMQTIFNKTFLSIAQNYILQGKPDQALSFLQFIPGQPLHKLFIKASLHFDQKQYPKVCQLLQPKLVDMYKQNLPQQDLIRYDCLKLLTLTHQQLRNPTRAEQIEIDMDFHRLYNNVDLELPKIHYFNLPFREFFQFGNFIR